ncbi:MAG TPA: hypothetical protein CFH81_04575 [Sulfurovum sp. UBA12169]|nr:MAG TPA: hypothetical protein CFH81_04575 [Sulfurovum sp. UBA12169]
MNKMIKLATLGVLVAAPTLYGASVAACVGCHGQQFEKAAMGKSKIVKDMAKEEIIASLKGYKDGSYGGAMKGLMTGQVASLDDAKIEAIAALIKGGAAVASDKATEHAAASAVAEAKVIDINEKACDPERIKAEDLAAKKNLSADEIGLRKTALFEEGDETTGVKTDYERPAPGQSTRFERAYMNAPPMVPHSIEGMEPITKENNQCLGCHMPEVATGIGATPLPVTHFTNYRPETVMKGNEVLMEGKVVGTELKTVGDIKLAKTRQTDEIYQGRFNCTQCHAPQANVDTAVANTFTPDFKDGKGETASSLMDVMNEGVR